MKKLVETNAPDIFIPTRPVSVVESKTPGRKAYVIEGIFGKVNVKNENNRRYPRSVWDKNLAEDSRFRKRLKMRTVLGELEHPESGNTHLERVSHIVADAWMETLTEARIKELNLAEMGVAPGEYVMGRYELLDTPRGNILRALHEAGVKVGISSRGRGDVRQVNGIDEVQDNYELDTWDCVYLPSVIEAYPSPRMTEANGDLGSQLPGASAAAGMADAGAAEMGTPTTPSAQQDVTPSNTHQNWKSEAEQIVRKLEQASSAEDQDLVELVELFPRGIDLIDQLAGMDDPDAIKLKSQALTLLRVLTNKIMRQEVGDTTTPKANTSTAKSSGSSEKKSSSEKKPEGEKKEKEEPKAKEKEEKTKKESVAEGTLRDLASGISSDMQRAGRKAIVLKKGELEAHLNKAGHTADESKIRELSNELRAQGINSDPDKYESIAEATEEELSAVVDGCIVAMPAKKILDRIHDCGEKVVLEFLKKQKGDVLVRVCSKGNTKCVVRLLEPAYGESNIVLDYEDMRSADTKPNPSKKEESMNVQEMVEELVKENDKLRQTLGTSGGVPEVRYEAAKKLIAGLVERCKKINAELIHERKRTKAAAKLIHKMAGEKKAKKDEKDEAVAPAITAPVVEQAAKPVPPPAPATVTEKIDQLTEGILRNTKIAPKIDAEPAKVTEESKDVMKRIRGKDTPAPVVESTPNLMSATARRLNG